MRSSGSASEAVPLTRAADAVLALVERRGARRLVIDGRSGAGKTTLARTVAERWPGGTAQVVSLDELYPGWGGLREGAELARALVLEPHRDGVDGRYRRFDWEIGSFAGPERVVSASRPLIVEGCGALTPAAGALADAAVWLDGDAARRRARAFARDGDGFVPYWEMWATQEDAHILSAQPAALADVALLTV